MPLNMDVMKYGKFATNRRAPLKCFMDRARHFDAHMEYDQKALGVRRDCRKSLVDVMETFGKETTIHGLCHVFASRRSRFERVLWALGFLIALTTLIYACQVIARRYFRSEFKTVIDSTNYPIYKINFPEVTICNRNRLNWARFEQAKRIFLAPSQHNSTIEQDFLEIVARYDNFTYGEFERFGNLSRRALTQLNYINFTAVARYMSWRCHELLTDCMWRRRIVDCCTIFIRRRSQLGLCMAFNSVESARGTIKLLVDPKWPWRVTRGGPGSGLRVRVLLNELQHSPFAPKEKGASLMVLEPHVWYYAPQYVQGNTRTSVVLDAAMNFNDPETRRLPSSVRECVFQDERSSRDFKSLYGHKYMFENCKSECQQEYLMRYCNCTMDLFFPTGQYPICKLADMPCLAANNYRLLHFEQLGEWRTDQPCFECKCLPNCRSIKYLTRLKSLPLQPHQLIANMSYIDLDFSFKLNFIMIFKTKFVFTWVELLVSFGGIAALFLGCSLISIVEMIYFFVVEVPQRKWQQRAKFDETNLFMRNQKSMRRSQRIHLKFEGFVRREKALNSNRLNRYEF